MRHYQPMTVDTVFIIENGPGSGHSDRWARRSLTLGHSRAARPERLQAAAGAGYEGEECEERLLR